MQSKAPDAGDVPLHELLAEVLAGDLSDGGFEVRYQPIVRLGGGATVAVEAVACWEHPRVGQVAPAQFTAAAERAGLSAVLVCEGSERRADAGDEGEEVRVQEGRACSDAVIAKHYALGQQLGIPGTPMIVMSDGTSLGGYMSPHKLLAALEEHAAEAAGKSHEQ